MNKLINLIKMQKKKFIIIGLFIVLIVIFLCINIINNNRNSNKDFKNKDYVYTQIENNNSKLPYINIKGAKIEKVNDILYDVFYDVVNDKRNSFNYKYYLDDEILYIFIDIVEYINDIKNPRYIAYYININTGNLYNVEDILNKHKLTLNDVSQIIDEKLNSSYIEETELGYVEKGFCDFECYKDIHNINPLNKRLSLFYDGKKLIGYLNYMVETIYYVDTNPVEFPHIFKIKE